jgi:hypothetical protein
MARIPRQNSRAAIAGTGGPHDAIINLPPQSLIAELSDRAVISGQLAMIPRRHRRQNRE